MKILQPNAGPLTNFEVLDFLRSKGAGKDPTRVIAAVLPSEFKVYDYLVETAACNQTREVVNEFVGKCKNYDISKAEILNIINIRPASVVELDPIIQSLNTEEAEPRLEGSIMQELVETIDQILPSPPDRGESDEGTGQDEEAPDDGQNEAET